MDRKKNDQYISAKLYKRIIAFIIDTLLIYMVVYFFRKAFLSTGPEIETGMQIRDGIMNGLLLSFYSILFKGQTIGKRMMKIQIVCSNDERLDLMSLLNREIFGKVFIERMNLWILLLLSYTGYLETILDKVVDEPLYLIIWYLVSLPWIMFLSFTMLVNSKGQLSLHDQISGTRVIEKSENAYNLNKSKVQL